MVIHAVAPHIVRVSRFQCWALQNAKEGAEAKEAIADEARAAYEEAEAQRDALKSMLPPPG